MCIAEFVFVFGLLLCAAQDQPAYASQEIKDNLVVKKTMRFKPETHRTWRMARRMDRHTATTIQVFIIFQPTIRVRSWRIGHAEQGTLLLKRIP